MLTTITYKAALNRNGYTTDEGLRHVVITIYSPLTKERVTVNTHIRVKKENFRYGKVQPADANHDIYNRKIPRIIRRLMEYEDEMEQSGVTPSPGKIRDAWNSKVSKSSTITEFVGAVIEPSTRSQQTKAAYYTLAREAEKFDRNVRMDSVCHDWIERWRASMVNHGLSENTIKGRLKQLHCLTQEAIKRDILTGDPFKWITIGNMTPRPEFLTKQEIRKLERVKLTGREAKVRDLFLLSVYTGLRWSDLTTLDEADISGGIIRKRMYKTKRDVTIPIKTLFWGKGQQILDRYQPITRLCRCVKCNSTANRIIKDIAKRAGITKRVHFHLARKTCSTMLNALGLPAGDITSILGHAKIETTQKYYIFGKEESLIKSSRKLFKQSKEEKDDG